MSNIDMLILSQQRKQKQDEANMFPILFTVERNSHYEQNKRPNKKAIPKIANRIANILE